MNLRGHLVNQLDRQPWITAAVLLLLATSLSALFGDASPPSYPGGSPLGNSDSFSLGEFMSILGVVSSMLLLVLPVIRERGRTMGVSRSRKPPIGAEYLFYFLEKKNCDALVGDLEERYGLILKKFGRRRANFWYWTQAIQSIGPLALAWVKKAALKPLIGVIACAVAKGLLDLNTWLTVLVELFRRIRS